MAGSPKHDVAFSFRSQDEPLARKLADALLGEFSSFVFSQKQQELAGTDGTESLRVAFLEDSRLNVVLYRKGWGEAGWTGVEAKAIQDRAFQDGWEETILFVVLDGAADLPKWLPKTPIRFNLEEYGFEQALGVIKARALQQGASRTLLPYAQDNAGLGCI